MSRLDQRTEGLVDFKPIQPQRAFEEIILQIEQAVIEGRLAAGDRLPPERELAEKFKVSRNSVREALRILEAFGVISARRGVGADSGSIVSAQNSRGLAGMLRLYTSLQRISLWDLLEVRQAIEMLTARTAAERASPEQVAELLTLVDEMRKAHGQEEFLQLDAGFHLAIARVSGNSMAPVLMEALREVMAREMLSAYRILKKWPAERDVLIHDHSGIAEKIRAGNAEGAASAVREHIHGFYTRVLAEAAPRPAKLRSPRRREAARPPTDLPIDLVS